MELKLERIYYPGGTNGNLYLNGDGLCHSIELPWKGNEPRRSCIPEGRYELSKRYSAKFGWHLLVKNVQGRSLILIHPANNAQKELKGCIAPVSILTGAGRGTKSRIVFDKLLVMVYKSLDRNEPVFLNITAADPGKGKARSSKILV
jgi:hypothetical protein